MPTQMCSCQPWFHSGFCGPDRPAHVTLDQLVGEANMFKSYRCRILKNLLINGRSVERIGQGVFIYFCY